jgi:hypothetical protein
VVAGSLLLFAFEGVVCLAMAFPIALVTALLGGWVGREIALRAPAQPATALLTAWLVPLLGMRGATHGPLPVFEVASSVVVDASPDLVWRHVVSFPDLPSPREPLFRSGVAYPIRAVITGRGVGAIRRCEFSTGAFVEPITTWDAPHRLAFDVDASPAPMVEWSPYRGVHPAHLDGYFRARRGEFRLVELPGGRTRLEGRTWYTIDIHPAPYWRLFADPIVHVIHRRVLEHVKRLSESDAGSRAAVASPPDPSARDAVHRGRGSSASGCPPSPHPAGGA